jgi:hypothetical protein
MFDWSAAYGKLWERILQGQVITNGIDIAPVRFHLRRPRKKGVVRRSLSHAKALSGRWPLRFRVQAVVKRWRCCGEWKGRLECKNGRTRSHHRQIGGCAAASTRLLPLNRSWSPSGRAQPSLHPARFEQDVGATSSYGSRPSDLTL